MKKRNTIKLETRLKNEIDILSKDLIDDVNNGKQ